MAAGEFDAKDVAGNSVPFAVDVDGLNKSHQYVKIEFGADGTQTPVTAAAPLPVVVSSALPAGAAALGSVTVTSMPAADRTTDSMAVAFQTGVVMSGGTALTVKYAKISCSSSGVNIVVAAVTSKKIRVLAWDLSASGTVNAKWQSHTTPTDLTGLYYEVANTGISKDFNPLGYFESLSGESLDLNLSGAVAVGGSLLYIEV